jgi:simple sugar transport system permease protein
MISEIFTAGMLAATLRIATPLLLAALGAAFCLKANVFNIALEGFMLLGAFLAVVLAAYLGNSWLGLLLAVVITSLAAAVFGYVTVSLGADQVIAGLGFNTLMLGLTSWLLQSVLFSPGGFSDPRVQALPDIELAGLQGVPLLGPIFASQDILVYAAWGLAGLAYIFVHQTAYGLRLRATGEHPLAATTVGIRTERWQYLAVILSGALAALAGASISLSNLRLFSQGMTAGRGFIAFTAATFAGGNIPGTVLITLLFAFFGSVAIRLEGFGLPTHFVQMIPYLVTVGALIVVRRRANPSS